MIRNIGGTMPCLSAGDDCGRRGQRHNSRDWVGGLGAVNAFLLPPAGPQAQAVAVPKRNNLTDPHRHQAGISCADHDLLPPETGHLLHLDSRSRYRQPERYASTLPERRVKISPVPPYWLMSPCCSRIVTTSRLARPQTTGKPKASRSPFVPRPQRIVHVGRQERAVREPDLCTNLCTRRDGTG